MTSPYLLATVTAVLARLTGTFRGRMFLFACVVVLVELALRHLAPKSVAYRRWTATFQAVGKFWTAILLSIVYFLTVSLISAVTRVFGSDPLDRTLRPEPSFWRKHEANPLGPRAAARHQF